MAKPPPPFFVLKGHEGSVTALHFTNEKDNILKTEPTLISGSDIGEIFIYDLQSFRTIFRLSGHDKNMIMFLNYYKSNILSQGKDGVFNIWSYSNQEWSISRKFESENVGFCAPVFWLVEDTANIAMINQTKTIDFYDIDKESKVKEINLKANLGMCMCLKAINIDKRWFMLTGFENGDIILWDCETGKEVHSLKCHKEPVMCLDFDSQHKMAGVSGSSDEFIEVWKITENFQLEKTRQIVLKSQGISAIRIRDDGKVIIVAGWDFYIRLFSWKTLKPLAILRFHTLSVQCLACSSYPVNKQNSVFASGSKDTNIALWSLY